MFGKVQFQQFSKAITFAGERQQEREGELTHWSGLVGDFLCWEAFMYDKVSDHNGEEAVSCVSIDGMRICSETGEECCNN